VNAAYRWRQPHICALHCFIGAKRALGRNPKLAFDISTPRHRHLRPTHQFIHHSSPTHATHCAVVNFIEFSHRYSVNLSSLIVSTTSWYGYDTGYTGRQLEPSERIWLAHVCCWNDFPFMLLSQDVSKQSPEWHLVPKLFCLLIPSALLFSFSLVAGWKSSLIQHKGGDRLLVRLVLFCFPIHESVLLCQLIGELEDQLSITTLHLLVSTYCVHSGLNNV